MAPLAAVKRTLIASARSRVRGLRPGLHLVLNLLHGHRPTTDLPVDDFANQVIGGLQGGVRVVLKPLCLEQSADGIGRADAR